MKTADHYGEIGDLWSTSIFNLHLGSLQLCTIGRPQDFERNDFRPYTISSGIGCVETPSSSFWQIHLRVRDRNRWSQNRRMWLCEGEPICRRFSKDEVFANYQYVSEWSSRRNYLLNWKMSPWRMGEAIDIEDVQVGRCDRGYERGEGCKGCCECCECSNERQNELLKDGTSWSLRRLLSV